tara:strand:- start:35 stop:1072 length:1038 start_codon:yes stop_codon:yes gene_type:complete
MIFNYKILFFIPFLLFFNYIVIKISSRIKLKKVFQIQDIHAEDTSRFGGLVIIITSIVFFSVSKDYMLLKVILVSSIAIIPAILEDLRIFVKPLVRLFLIFTSSYGAVLLVDTLPVFNILFLLDFLNNHYFKLLFFTLGLAILMNGQNIIDGTNGLSSFTSLSIFSCLFYIGLYKQDYYLINLTSFFIICIVCFIVFNFPFGKIFLGDSGSYFLGFFSGYLVIKTYGQYSDLPTWSAMVILLYPTLEVCFSYFRKIFQGSSPFLPDNKHLHLKIYFLIQKGHEKSTLYNSLVTPFLAIMWLTPLVALPFVIQIPKASFLVMFLMVLCYVFFYYSIPEPSKENQKI